MIARRGLDLNIIIIKIKIIFIYIYIPAQVMAKMGLDLTPENTVSDLLENKKTSRTVMFILSFICPALRSGVYISGEKNNFTRVRFFLVF